MTFEEWLEDDEARNGFYCAPGSDIGHFAKKAFSAGAASRDAEVAELVEALEHSVLYVPDLATVPGIAAALAKVRKP